MAWTNEKGTRMNTTIPNASDSLRRREDLLVSICLCDAVDTFRPEVVNRIARDLGLRFRYWEILVMVEAFEPELFDSVRNLRQLLLPNGTDSYGARALAAVEAIGDVVVLTTTQEAAHLDLATMVENAQDSKSVTVAKRRQTGLLDPLLGYFGTLSGYRVRSRETQSMAFPRPILNTLLTHPDTELTLRFVPAASSVPVLTLPELSQDFPRDFRDFKRRLKLLHKLIVAVAPRLLWWVTLLSGGVFLVSLTYMVYAVLAWLTLDEVEPGWLTTSLVLSMTSAFLSTAIFALAIGLQKVIDLLLPDTGPSVLEEKSNVDLFSEVLKELNVEQSQDTPNGLTSAVTEQTNR